MKALVAMLAVLALAGCAERWQKPGASEADFKAMRAQCDAHAFGLWPPRLREEMVMPGRFVPPMRSCDSRGRCTWYGGWWEPPQFAVMDDAAPARRAERRACFLAEGWTPVEE